MFYNRRNGIYDITIIFECILIVVNRFTVNFFFINFMNELYIHIKKKKKLFQE